MRRFNFLLLLLVITGVYGQENILQKCTGYAQFGNTLVLEFDNGERFGLKLLSETMIKFHYPRGEKPADKNFLQTSSYAVIDELPEKETELKVNETSSAIEFYTTRLRVRINKNPFRIQIFDKYQKLILEDYASGALVKNGDNLITYKTMRKDEGFFGLGEKSGSINRRGKSFIMWNSDKPCYGVNEDPLYKSIPFFFSNYQYGIFFDNTYKTKFDLGSSSDEYFSFETPGGDFTWYFFWGTDYKHILEQYIHLTGKPIIPPKWAFGFAQSRGMYVYEKQALEIAQEFRKRQIPCDIIYQDIGWVEGLQSFDWRKDRYQDPKEMLQKLKSMGFKMIVSQDPVISKTTEWQWKAADSLGFFAKDVRTGKTYDMPWPWGGDCGVVDFTNPDVAAWWGKLQQKPIDDGVSGFWTDMGEPAWSNETDIDRLNMRHYAGMHDEIHNVYGLLWDKVVTEEFEKHNPGKRIFQMTRAAFAGIQRYSFGWSGDSGNGDNVLEGWGQFANQVTMGISAGLGGIPFWTTDISGYCGDITSHQAMAELYVRWMQFGIFNPLSRAHHEGDNAVEPWMFGEEAEKIAKSAIELKYRLFPYIYSYARIAHEKGLPLMRPLFMEFPDDDEAYAVNDQFMFGEEILVAPVVKKGAVSRRIYLPEGEWADFHQPGKIYSGGQYIDYAVTLKDIPIFIKKGSVIPMMPVMQYIHEKMDYPVTLFIHPPSLGQSASFLLYEDDGITTDYKMDIHSETLFQVNTKAETTEVLIYPREENGYKHPGKRGYYVRMSMEKKPSLVQINGKKIKIVISKSLDSENIPVKEECKWNEQTKTLLISVFERSSLSELIIRK